MIKLLPLNNFKNSNSLKEKARKNPAMTGTFSCTASSFVEGAYPVYANSASGAYFTDVDGNEYLDYLMGLGQIILGYNYESLNQAIISQLKEGI